MASAEVMSLILDCYFSAGSSELNISEFEILKSKVLSHFNQRIHQQITTIKADNFLQSLSYYSWVVIQHQNQPEFFESLKQCET